MFYVLVVAQTQLDYVGLVAEQTDVCVPVAVGVVQHSVQLGHQLGVVTQPTDSVEQDREMITAD
jgi:hypothetical protein